MREVVRGIVVGAALLLIAGAIASRTGCGDVVAPRTSGPGAWLVACASGFAAFIALSFDVIVGLVVSRASGIADSRADS